MRYTGKFQCALSLFFILILGIINETIYSQEQAKLASISVTTSANVPVEISFTSAVDYSDPFNEVILDVVFTDPKGLSRKVPAFWAGGHNWKVRYASPQIGLHHWWTECSNKNDSGLNEVKGIVNIVPYHGENALFMHGPIRIASDSRHFEYADGTPFFWLGDTWWMGLSKRLIFPEEFKQLTADRKDKGFNVVQLVAGLFPDMYPFDPRGANEAGFPWEKEYTSIRPEYFDAADLRLKYLMDQGFTTCIVGAWGYFMGWMGEAKLKAHWRYLIARYGAFPVVWCAGGEVNLPWYRVPDFPYDDQAQALKWCDIMRFIRTTDPWHRPLTVHPTAVRAFTARHVVDDESLLDFDFLQTPHMGSFMDVEVPVVNTVVQSRAASPVMPVINGECCFEMLLDQTPAEKPRHMFWLCMINGAAGHTYGANGIWQLNRKGDPHGASPTAGAPTNGYGLITWEEAMHLEGGRQVAAGKTWLSNLPWWTFQPHFTWVTWAAEKSDVPPGAIGCPNGYRVFYMIEAKPVVLHQLEPGSTYSIKYYDPVDAKETDGGFFSADSKGKTTLLAPKYNHDWVVLIQPVWL
jgi:hypothetical protein